MIMFILYKIGATMALIVPPRIGYTIATLIVYFKYPFSYRERHEIVENLKLVLPGTDVKTLISYSRKIFINFSKYLVDFFRFKKVDLKYIEEHVEIVHRDYIDEALKKGKGAIILSAHLGSWELGGAVMGLLGYSFNAIVLSHEDKLVNNFFVSQRQMKNEKVISIDFALRKCFSALAKNELLAIVGDKDYAKTGVVVKFFGKDTLLPKGPAIFNLKMGAAIIPGFTIRASGDNFKLVFEKPIEYSPSGDFEADVKNFTELCGKALEKAIRQYPTQWYCFRRFWKR